MCKLKACTRSARKPLACMDEFHESPAELRVSLSDEWWALRTPQRRARKFVLVSKICHALKADEMIKYFSVLYISIIHVAVVCISNRLAFNIHS